MKILFLGHGKWACLTLRSLYESGHELVGVVAETDAFDIREAESNHRLARYGAFESLKEAAGSLGIKLFQPADILDPGFITCIDALQPQLIVSVSYHAIFKKPWFEKYNHKIINVHLAPLPYYRGRSPLNWAIINGETHTAITVHFIDEGVDTGPIIMQEQIPIHEDDRAIDVLLKALPLFPKLVLASIHLIQTGQVIAKPQPPYSGTYFPQRTPEDGLINWQTETTRDIYNKVRALSYPYPGAFSHYKSQKVVFERSKFPNDYRRITPVGGLVIARNPESGVRVTTSDGWLDIETIRINDNEMPAAEGLRIGSRFSP